ncbi:non-heme iron oxygenase ferredoxin subunit [Candidatus Woesearchaeota archaeon]|nr:non-heme iron oxygenase ferredoxin subunit [Candidatus Woesearchaeota archaeon]
MLKKVATLAELKDYACVTVDGKELALFRLNGNIYCLDNTCTHRGGPLCEGSVTNSTITCPWHASQFDIKTGKVKRGPAMKDVKTYKVTVKNDSIYLEV